MKKKTIYGYFKKKKPFTSWSKNLKKYYNFKAFYNQQKFLENFLFYPPDLLLYYHSKDSQNIDTILNELKIKFNLVKIPFILIVDHIDFDFLVKESDMIDDFLTINHELEELILRIEYAFKRVERISDNNPLTGLPGNTFIREAITKILKSVHPYAVAYVDLDNFKAYNDYYGFDRGDEIIKNLARILVSTISEYCKNQKYFIGHIGGDDFVFIVPLEKVKEISQEIIQKFDTLITNFIDEEDLKKGYFLCKNRRGELQKIPFPSVSIAIVPVHKGKFKHIGEVITKLTEIKNYIKRFPGSNYFIDRRH